MCAASCHRIRECRWSGREAQRGLGGYTTSPCEPQITFGPKRSVMRRSRASRWREKLSTLDPFPPYRCIALERTPNVIFPLPTPSPLASRLLNAILALCFCFATLSSHAQVFDMTNDTDCDVYVKLVFGNGPCPTSPPIVTQCVMLPDHSTITITPPAGSTTLRGVEMHCYNSSCSTTAPPSWSCTGPTNPPEFPCACGDKGYMKFNGSQKYGFKLDYYP